MDLLVPKPRHFIVDLDDTLVRTWLWWLAHPAKDPTKSMDTMEFVPGAEEFLSLYGGETTLLTAGEESWQEKKFARFKMRDRVSRVIRVDSSDQKRDVISELRDELDGFEIYVIGDRVDAEIRAGRTFELQTIRLHLPEGEHANAKPFSKAETPHHTFPDFQGILELLKRNPPSS